jgi:hypothetical protein
MIRVKFRFGTANRKEMSWMSETSALMDTLRQEGVSPDLLRAVEKYRTAHPLAEALRPRIPSPAFVYYGSRRWPPCSAAKTCCWRAARPPARTCWPKTSPPPSDAPRGTSRSTSIWTRRPSSAWTPLRADRSSSGPARSTAAPRAAASAFWTRSTWPKTRRWPSCTRCWISAAPSMCRATSASRWPRRPASSPP